MTTLTAEQLTIVKSYKQQADFLSVVAANLKTDRAKMESGWADSSNFDSTPGYTALYMCIHQNEKRYYEIIEYLDSVEAYFSALGLDIEELAEGPKEPTAQTYTAYYLTGPAVDSGSLAPITSVIAHSQAEAEAEVERQLNSNPSRVPYFDRWVKDGRIIRVKK